MVVEIIPQSKICTKCSIEKPLSEFGNHKIQRDGLKSHCKDCIKNKDAARYAANSEKAKDYSASYRAENPEKVRSAYAKWYIANQDKKKASSRAWRDANPERVRTNNAAWSAANPDKMRTYGMTYYTANFVKWRIKNHKRRAAKQACGGKLSVDIAERLFKLQRGKCACCGKPLGKNFHIDHVMPLALDGANLDSNIQLLRQRCNLQKSAKDPIDFMQQRGFLL